MYGTAPDRPDALAVRSGLLVRHRFVVPAAAIAAVDARRKVIALRIARADLRRFL
jgi:membrane protein YdbS with pleckstrin-like domain